MKKLLLLPLLVLFLLPSFAHASLLTNLTSYYKFDESSGNAADSVGTNTLTNVGSVTYASAVINNGASMSSVAQRFTTPDNAALDFSTAVSMSVWIKLGALPGTDTFQSLVTKWENSAGAQRAWIFRLENNGGTYSIAMVVSNDGTANDAQKVTWPAPAISTWYHIVITYSSGSEKFYLNGSQLGTTQTSSITSIFDSSSAMLVNAVVPSSPTEGGNLVMDELGLWSRDLTSTEVSSLYNAGAGLQYPFGLGATFAPWQFMDF